MRASQDELAEHLDRHLSGDGMIDVAPGLAVYKCLAPMGPIYRVSEPSLCVIAQGTKDVFLARETPLRCRYCSYGRTASGEPRRRSVEERPFSVRASSSTRP